MVRDMNEIEKEIGARLKAKRILKGMSQKHLADRLDVSIKQINKYESSENKISSERLFCLAKMFSVPIDYFFQKFIEKDAKTLNSLRKNLLDSDEKELITLINAYTGIENKDVRNKIIHFIQSVPRDYERP
jgi:transcriptional regulator with XRE-family HTH domain